MTETIKISNLPPAGVLDGTERVPIVKNGVTKITTTQQIGNLFNGDFPSLQVAQGGTGRTSLDAYALIAGGTTSTGAVQSVSGTGTTGQALVSNGASALPTWQSLPAAVGQALTKADDTNVTLTLGGSPTTALLSSTSITAGWSGQLAISRGGTGQATASAAFDALAPTTTRGDLIFRNATTNTRLAASTSGYHLQTNGAGTDPTWAGFLQAGTGAVTRTWQAKARDTVSVTDFGAALDGSTDDTSSFVNAVVYCYTNDKTLVIPDGVMAIDAVSITLTGDLRVECSATILNRSGTSQSAALIAIDGSSYTHSLTWRGGIFRGASTAYSLLSIQYCDTVLVEIDEADGIICTASSPTTASAIVVLNCNDVTVWPGFIHDLEEGGSIHGSIPRCVSIGNCTDATVFGGYFRDFHGVYVLAGNQRVVINGTVAHTGTDNGIYNVTTGSDRYSGGSVTAIGCRFSGFDEPIVHNAPGVLAWLGGELVDIPNSIGMQDCGELILDGAVIRSRPGGANIIKTRLNTACDALRVRNCYIVAEVANGAIDLSVGTVDYVEFVGNSFIWIHNSAYTPSTNIVNWPSGVNFNISGNTFEFYDATADIASGNWNLITPTSITAQSFCYGNTIVNYTGNASAIFRFTQLRQQLVGFDDMFSVFNLGSDTAVNYADPTSAPPRRVWGSTVPTNGYWTLGSVIWNTAPTSTSALYWVCTTAGSPGTWRAVGALPVAVADGGTGATTARAAAANIGSWYILAASAVGTSRNSINAAGDTTEATLVTVTVPANAMGPNGGLRVRATWGYTNSASTKTIRTRWGGLTGTRIREDSVTTTASLKTVAELQNVNSTSSQKAANAFSASRSGWDPSTGTVATSAQNTTSAVDIVFTTAWGAPVAGETITLESYVVELFYGA